MRNWQALGIRPTEILLPKPSYLNRHWPVVACDQYTSQPELWMAVDREIGEAPSTLRLIVPEAFLEETEERSQAVARAMADYLQKELFRPLPESFVLVERSTQSGSRVGLMLAIDLEEYDYAPGSRSLIRATEQTVLDRIPPRLKVREQAEIELPHVMLLIDDPEDRVLGPLYAARSRLPLLYDIPLLMQGGQVRGWQVAPGSEQDGLADALAALKAGLSQDEFLYAVGDGNHSLAAAKAGWEKQKSGLSADERLQHPARYALVELVNLHSPALLFDPIHRLAFGTDRGRMLSVLQPLKPVEDAQAPDIRLIGAEGELPLRLTATEGRLVVDAVQQLLDEAKLPLDYVHGLDALREIALREHGTGILMPDFPKDQLFTTVQRDGRLPRKTFSMGEANEKRFYLEARRIR